MDLLTNSAYKWPSKYDSPFSHQRVTAEFFIRNKRCFCFNEIGTTKTLSALWAADFLMVHKAINKVLVTAPLSTLWSVWDNEIWSNLFHRKAVVLHGSREKRLKLLKEDVDFYIINHEGIKIILDDLKKRDDIDLVIMDEGAKLRNSRTDLWKASNVYMGKSSGRGLWWMTGSPMPGGPTDCWAQAKIVDPDLVPRYFTRFREEVSYQTMMGAYPKWVPFKGWENKCFKILQPSIRYTREECLDLPDCTVQTRQVEMSATQAKAYNEMLRTFRAQLDDGMITAVNEGVKRIKLMQLAAGAVYDGTEFVHNLNCSSKLTALSDVIETAGNKALVFVSFKHSIPLLQKYLEKKGLSVEAIYGGVSAKNRNRIFSEFQNGALQVIVAHPECMAHGLTLTASNTIVWWSPIDSYATYEQANGRITRPGQKFKQTIVQLICSAVEKKIYQRLSTREKMQGLLTDLLKEK